MFFAPIDHCSCIQISKTNFIKIGLSPLIFLYVCNYNFCWKVENWNYGSLGSLFNKKLIFSIKPNNQINYIWETQRRNIFIRLFLCHFNSSISFFSSFPHLKWFNCLVWCFIIVWPIGPCRVDSHRTDPSYQISRIHHKKVSERQFIIEYKLLMTHPNAKYF